MPRITRVYTRAGDTGTTSLGGGQRLAKDSLRIAAYGDVDELNSVLGTVLAAGVCDRVAAPLRRIQNDLFHLGSDLCVLEEDKKRLQIPQVEQRHVKALEALMDELMQQLEPLENFILPGGTAAAAHLHVARAVCRRVERQVIALSRQEGVGPHVIPYLNRLSDALFVMARFENRRQKVPDVTWDSRA